MEGGVRFLEFEVQEESVLIALEHITRITSMTFKADGSKYTRIESADGKHVDIDINYKAVKTILKYAEER